MAAKISVTENLGEALGYNFKKVEKEETNILLAAELYQGEGGRYTMEDIFADTETLIPKNCHTKKTVFHCSLNPHPNEKLFDEQLTQTAKECMEAPGCGNQPYIVFKHSDISREHIYTISLRMDSRGQKINDKSEKQWGKQVTDTLEKRFGLIPSSKVTDKAMKETLRVNIGKGNIRKQVTGTLRSVLKHYKLYSLRELSAILSVYDLAVEEVKTELRGKKYEGLIYVPAGDKGDKVSSPIHTSDIGRDVGYTTVRNRIQKFR